MTKQMQVQMRQVFASSLLFFRMPAYALGKAQEKLFMIAIVYMETFHVCNEKLGCIQS